MKKTLTAVTMVIALVFGAMFGLMGPGVASSTRIDPFTQSELDDNWEADRTFPTDGVTSVSEFDRDNVARIGIDSDQTESGTFWRTEGIKTLDSDDFGQAVQVDLYVDPDWQDKAVRAGFWVVGDDGAGERDNWFGIIEFVNLEPSDSGDSVEGDHEGWRIWDSEDGWTHLGTEFEYGEWVTLLITLDTADQEYDFFIDGELVGTGPGGEHFIRELFLNSYNYGLDEFPNLSNGSYAAHWHAGGTCTNVGEGFLDGSGVPGFDDPGTLLNTGESEDGPVSGPIHDAEGDAGPAPVHEVNCDAVVTVESLLP